MKKLLLVVCMILGLTIPCWAGSTVVFSWNANLESDLKEYRLYQAEASGNYVLGVDSPVAIIPAGTVTSTLIDVADGHKYWVLTAVDLAGNESGKSNEVNAVLDSIAPGAPGGLNVVTVTVTVGQ